MLEQLRSFDFTGLMGLSLYWVPFVLCSVSYFLKTHKEYREELRARDSSGHYYPKLTVGTIVGRAFCTVVPLINLLALVFDAGPFLLSSIYKKFDMFLDYPIVKPIRKVDQGRLNQ